MKMIRRSLFFLFVVSAVHASEDAAITRFEGAIRQNNWALLEKLIDEKGNLDFYFNSIYGNATPLHQAIYYNKPELVQCLLKKGALNGIFDGLGRRPLHAAAECNNVGCVKLLLDHEAVCDACDRFYGKTALHVAASYQFDSAAGVIALLLSRGANIHKKAKNRRTALHFASIDGNDATIEFLLKNGAASDLNIKDESGFTPRDLALRVGRIALASRLQSFDPDQSKNAQ